MAEACSPNLNQPAKDRKLESVGTPGRLAPSPEEMLDSRKRPEMGSNYIPPKGSDFRIEVLDGEAKDYFIDEITKQLRLKPNLIVVWNERQVAYMSPDPEQDKKLAQDLEEFLNKRDK